LIRAFKVETGISKDRAAAAAEGYLPSFIAFIVMKGDPPALSTFSFYHNVGEALLL